jgi:hypothetical protein
MKTFRIVYVPDPDDKRYLTLFARGFPTSSWACSRPTGI